MTLELIVNRDAAQTDVHKIARAVYAECGASSLAAVEALCAMIANVARTTGRAYVDVACDEQILPAQSVSSRYFDRMQAPATSRGFQMCLRVARRMMTGSLADVCRGAVRFHHADELPEWALARGYIADIDGMLFYR